VLEILVRDESREQRLILFPRTLVGSAIIHAIRDDFFCFSDGNFLAAFEYFVDGSVWRRGAASRYKTVGDKSAIIADLSPNRIATRINL